ncbi:MAG: MFS transporter [Succinivibrio sp.]
MYKEKLSIFVLIFNMLLLSSANTMVMPFLPLYLKSELYCDKDSLSFYTALAYSVTFIVSFFISPVWGRFADRFGKKPMLIRVSFILALSYLFSYLSTNPLELCLSRALQGLASGMTPAFLGLVSEIDHKNKTATIMGFIQSANLSGTIIGPALGGALCQITSVRDCYFIIMCVSFVTLLLNIFLISENRCSVKLCEDSNQIRDLIKDRLIVTLSLCTLATSMSIMMVVPMLSDYVIRLSGFDNAIALSGLIFSLSGAAGVIASPIWGKISSYISLRNVIVLCLLLSSLCYLVQGFVTDIAIFALLQFLFGFFICAIAPSVHSIISVKIAPEHRTKAYSLIYSSSQAGNLSGPVMLCIFIGSDSYEYVFFSIALILFLSSALSVFLLKKIA